MSTQNVLKKLPTEATYRKDIPIVTGAIDYFPLALAEVSRVSLVGNRQHNGDNVPLRWAREKSKDHADCIVRHLVGRGTLDSDGVRHTAKVAWRALALLQEELEAAAGWSPENVVVDSRNHRNLNEVPLSRDDIGRWFLQRDGLVTELVEVRHATDYSFVFRPLNTNARFTYTGDGSYICGTVSRFDIVERLPRD